MNVEFSPRKIFNVCVFFFRFSSGNQSKMLEIAEKISLCWFGEGDFNEIFSHQLLHISVVVGEAPFAVARHRLQGARRGLGLWRDLDVRTRVEREQRAPNHPGGFEHVLGITTFLCVKHTTYLHSDLVKCLFCHFIFCKNIVAF